MRLSNEYELVAVLKVCLCVVGRGRNGKWASAWVASTCTAIADSVQKHLTGSFISQRSEWMESMTSTVECLQRQISDGVRLAERKVLEERKMQDGLQKVNKSLQGQLKKKESEATEERKAAQSASLLAEDLSSQLNSARLRERTTNEELQQWKEKVAVLERESWLAAQDRQEEVAQLMQRLLLAEEENKALSSKVQQLEKRLLETKPPSIGERDDDRDYPLRQMPPRKFQSQS